VNFLFKILNFCFLILFFSPIDRSSTNWSISSSHTRFDHASTTSTYNSTRFDPNYSIVKNQDHKNKPTWTRVFVILIFCLHYFVRHYHTAKICSHNSTKNNNIVCSLPPTWSQRVNALSKSSSTQMMLVRIAKKPHRNSESWSKFWSTHSLDLRVIDLLYNKKRILKIPGRLIFNFG